MESPQELKHYGIKGQKWGIRRYENPDGTLTEAGKKRYRYQNPDGSLTEEGKKNYMTAAKKGKLDVSKLSDNDLNMINSRFARENTYKQNIQKYEESKFSNQLKKAVIDRVKGSGGGGGGKGKSKGGIASLLAMPIKKAFEDAFKEDGKSGSGNNDKENQNPKPKAEEDDEARRGFKLGRHFARYGYKESDELRESRIKNGKRFLEGSLPLSMGPNRTAEDVVRDRRTPRAVRENDEWWRNSRESPDSWGWSSMRFDTSEYLVHGASQYVIVRFDELYHHGIKGQKWGIRRFQNDDGTLTPEGRERYGSEKDQKKLSKDIQNYWRNRKHYNKLTNWMHERQRKHLDNSPQMKTALADVRDSANKVKESIAIAQKFKDDYVSGKNKEADRYVSAFKKEHPDWAERGYDDASIRDSTFVRYLDDHPSVKQQRYNAYDQYNADRQKHAEACKKAASSFLKDYGNDKVTGLSVWAANKESSKRVEDVFATLIESNSLFDW